MKPLYSLTYRRPDEKINYTTSLEENVKLFEYLYSYSYNFSWIKRPANIISHYNIKEQESLTLFEDQLHIQRQDQLHIFALKEIKDLKLEFKYLIIPLIVGGIVFSLSLVGIFSSVLERWAGVLLVTIGIILLYFGIRGTYQFSVQTITHAFSFFIEEQDEGLNGFIKNFKEFNKRFKLK